MTDQKSRKRQSFARARPNKIHVRAEPIVCLADFVMSGLDWHDVCTYFAEDEMLQDLRSGLLEPHSSSDLGEYLYKVWLVASEEQFQWFIDLFETNLESRAPNFFGKALETFTNLCDAYM